MVDLTMVIVALTGLSALMKYYLPDKYVPALNVIAGVIAGYFYLDLGMMKENILYGGLIGLGISGFIDMASIPVKAIKGKIK